MYFARFGRLYYIERVNWKLGRYKIENCSTLVSEWIEGPELKTMVKDIQIIKK